MLMGHPSVQEAQSFKKSLNLFAKASVLVVIPNKSQVLFMNTAPNVKRDIVRILGFFLGVIHSKYLGAPLGVGELKSVSW